MQAGGTVTGCGSITVVVRVMAALLVTGGLGTVRLSDWHSVVLKEKLSIGADIQNIKQSEGGKYIFFFLGRFCFNLSLPNQSNLMNKITTPCCILYVIPFMLIHFLLPPLCMCI